MACSGVFFTFFTSFGTLNIINCICLKSFWSSVKNFWNKKVPSVGFSSASAAFQYSVGSTQNTILKQVMLIL
jgi:hypothetical protein